jgi:pyruvate/2-oxoglutarate dehydrogenase complex dihydrolipoamide dehydrogenase (E3) component
MLEIKEVPDHLIIIGGGYIGLEFAQAMKRLGAKVSVLEHNQRILKREDEDVASFLKDTLDKEGVDFMTGTSISSVSGKSGRTVVLKGTRNGETFEIEGSHILCATGRIPNSEEIRADVAGIKIAPSGHIKVDEWNRATDDGIFAVGDCAGSPYFTHIAFDDFRIVREYLSGKIDTNLARRSSRQVPFTLFTDPEFAHVGMREHEAREKSIQYRLAKLPMGVFLKTRTLGATEGFAKVLVAKDSDVILGFSAIGPGAGELLPVIQLAMKKNLPYSDIADLVITHPTLSEGLVALLSSVPER